MIIVQTPLRISFFGGGTDFPDFFHEEAGCVLSSAIDKYVFVTVKRRFDRLLRIGYTRTEMVERVDEIQHELIREALRQTGVRLGVEITTMADIPSAGTGLGSSSTVTVGALHALYVYQGEIVPAERLAAEACAIEIGRLHKPMGIQDQYIAAYGGLRLFEFAPDGAVHCERVQLAPAARRRFMGNLMLFYTGLTRQAADILGEQRKHINKCRTELRRLGQMARAARQELQRGDFDAVGCLLDEGWQLKKQLANGISNGPINAMYQAARSAGALGGKITGAGGGGFLLLYVPLERQERVRQALTGLRELPFMLEPEGTKVIFNYRRD
jgi:D-glycero-alpha-D-manno-heptose-7-phosphate kinase